MDTLSIKTEIILLELRELLFIYLFGTVHINEKSVQTVNEPVYSKNANFHL